MTNEWTILLATAASTLKYGDISPTGEDLSCLNTTQIILEILACFPTTLYTI